MRRGAGPGRVGRRRRAVTLGALGSLLVLAGCVGVEGEVPDRTGSASPSDGETAAEPDQDAVVGGLGTHDVNPVIDDDFPDPDVLEVDGTWYAYATNGNLKNVRVARSTDLVEWEQLPDALPTLPAWVIPGKTWAPEVTEIEPGRFVMYFTATNFSPALQCVGVAVADSPEGPFEAVGDEMLLCPQDEGGAIDAATFQDGDGTWHLLWKNDGNCCGHDTWLYRAPLVPDGSALAGEPVRMIKQDLPWEGELVEAPTLVERDGTFVLMYSANSYGGAEYTIGYATAPSLDGPWEKHPEPLFRSADFEGRYVGPGGQDVVVGPDGTDYLAFHSWYGGNTYRALNVLPLTWTDGHPQVTD